MKNYKIGGITIEEYRPEPCYRVSQYGKGLPITCNCTRCKKKGQTPDKAKAEMDLLYKK